MRPNPVAARMMAAALILPPALVLDVHASPAGENAVEPTTVVSSAANDQLLYFTSTSLLADDQRIVFLSDRSGQPNIFLRDLKTGKDKQLTFNTEGFLNYDTATGRGILCERVPKAWITHVQFSPRDNNLILYNHEWCSDSGIRRMWLWDGHRHIRRRTEGEGRRCADWTCHEMWERDGSAIIYHGSYQNGPTYVGRVHPDGSGATEIALPKEWNRYGHFTVGRPGWLVTDGCYMQPEDPKRFGGAWISVLKVDWAGRHYDWEPLCQHGSTWSSQDAHPHPIFNHAADAAYFTSDAKGRRTVCRVAVPEPPGL